jgi:hypothetical protein
MDRGQAIRWLSEKRFQRFLDAAEGDHNQAVALYQWHLELSAALFSMIHWSQMRTLAHWIDGGADEWLRMAVPVERVLARRP